VSRAGHLLACVSVGAVALAASPDALHGLLAIGVILGASLPDQTEGVFGFTASGQRLSILKHRGVTHTPWPWLAVLILGAVIAGFAGAAIEGLATGALVHIVLDAMSPSGVPLLPGREPWSIGYLRSGRALYVYRTGTLGEFRVLVPIVAASAVYAIVRAPAIAALASTLLTPR
jgi:inner membrane protein